MRASSAIPAAFPAVEVTEGPAAGWYFDGGTRLNAPIKPALSLGAERVIVVGLNSIAPAGADRIAGPERPDLFAGAAHVIDALLADPLVEDMQTLTTINELVGERRVAPITARSRTSSSRRRRATRSARIARDVFRRHYGGLLHAHRSPQLAFLGRLVAAGADPLHGELMSYLFFAPEFAHALIERGRKDAEAWLEEPHDEGLWDTGPLGRRKRCHPAPDIPDGRTWGGGGRPPRLRAVRARRVADRIGERPAGSETSSRIVTAVGSIGERASWWDRFDHVQVTPLHLRRPPRPRYRAVRPLRILVNVSAASSTMNGSIAVR